LASSSLDITRNSSVLQPLAAANDGGDSTFLEVVVVVVAARQASPTAAAVHRATSRPSAMG
jgi:hypothetical protein